MCHRKGFSRIFCDHIEQIFPFTGVRFIAVNDGYDSKETLDGNFKNHPQQK
ncbi:MAG: hypothetical protein RR705_03270 [Lachnospiraceae bacterium]